MATIRKRGKNYAVIYDYITENGERKQKWESFPSRKEADKRKIEIEKEKSDGSFVAPSAQTVNEFMNLFVELYGLKKWSLSSYSRNTRLIKNYINPILGKMKIQEITPLYIEKFYSDLKIMKVTNSSNQIEEKYVSTGTIKQIHKLLHCAFGVAVKWQVLGFNPFERIDPPKHVYAKRAIWTSDMIIRALEVCDDPKLAIAIHLAFACSLRLGEVLGLRWSDVHVEDEDIENDDAFIEVNCELMVVSKEAVERLNQKDVIFTFPTIQYRDTKNVTILKKPKTESSIRKIWLPETLACILKQWKKDQEEFKEFFQDEYEDYDLVVCHENGRQVTHSVIRKGLARITEKAGLPKVVFHSLRHSSTTYKLKLNNGDIKATQGDTGHSQADMVTDVYSHILDEDRKVNAQKFDDSFYRNGEEIDRKKNKVDVDALVNALKDNPELMKQLVDALG